MPSKEAVLEENEQLRTVLEEIYDKIGEALEIEQDDEEE